MSQKKIAFIGFWRSFNPHSFFLTKLLKENYDVIITEAEDADYVFFSVVSEDHWMVKDDCIKIFYTGEMVTPDFNACDYAIGFDWMEYGDRYFRLPLYYSDESICHLMEQKHQYTFNLIRGQKTNFCSITVSNAYRDPFFKSLYDEMSKYKMVDSGGKWNNNIGGRVGDKFAFDFTHKFSIVCENCAFPGYTTEKLPDAFAARCIPIYWGDPEITKVFNPQAFVNVRDYASIREVVDVVKRIDCDDRLYENMLREPVFSDNNYLYDKQMALFRFFLFNIFDCPLDQARRRNRVCAGDSYVRLKRIMRACTLPYLGFKAFKGRCGDIYRKFS